VENTVLGFVLELSEGQDGGAIIQHAILSLKLLCMERKLSIPVLEKTECIPTAGKRRSAVQTKYYRY
jgi:hypothetical protein